MKKQAEGNRRSLNQEVIVRLDGLRRQPSLAVEPAERLEPIRHIASQAARLPVLDTRSDADILGYREDGLPGGRGGAMVVTVEPADAELAERAFAAWRASGNGCHAAALNFGDCFAYALAVQRAEPLLFKGDDFSRTPEPA